MNVGSTFSGVGGIDLGLERAGMRVAWNCERDEWCRSVLAHHWPDAYQYADVRDVAREHAWTDESRPEPRGDIDLLCGGFPCQDVSVAGKRAGLAGARTGLFHEYARIADTLRPAWLLLENVPGLLSSNDGRDFGVVLGTLADLGYGVAWRVLDSRYFGVAQRRRRVFIVGRVGGDDGSALRALCESCDGDLAASRCSWQDAPARPRGSVARSINAGSRYDGDTEDFVIANALDTMRGGPDDNSAQANHLVATGFHMIQDPISTRERTPALGVKSSGMGVAVSENQRGELLETPYAHQLTAGGGKPGQGYAATRIGLSVRRLTPRECERLQSFPDDWTLVPGVKCPDSRRYAAMGNAVTVNVAEWIGRRIMMLDA